jgi:hypothetical protein
VNIVCLGYDIGVDLETSVNECRKLGFIVSGNIVSRKRLVCVYLLHSTYNCTYLHTQDLFI